MYIIRRRRRRTHLCIESMAQQLDGLLSILLRFARFRCIQNRCFDATRQRPAEQFRCKFDGPIRQAKISRTGKRARNTEWKGRKV